MLVQIKSFKQQILAILRYLSQYKSDGFWAYAILGFYCCVWLVAYFVKLLIQLIAVELHACCLVGLLCPFFNLLFSSFKQSILSPIHLPYRQKHARGFPCAFSKFFFLAGGVNFWSNFLNISLNFEKHIFLQSNGRFEILY